MPRVRVVNRHLKKRGGVWWLRKRVPEAAQDGWGKEWVEVSLHTSSLPLARQRRDAKLRELEGEWAALRGQAGSDDLASAAYEAGRGERRAAARGDEVPVSVVDGLVDQLENAAEAWGKTQGLYDPFCSTEEHDALLDRFMGETSKGRRLKAALDAAKGEASLTVTGEHWLSASSLSEGTKREYRRAFRVADGELPAPPHVTPEQARLFIQELAETGGKGGLGLSASSMENYRGALSGLWGYLGLDPSIWRGFRVEYGGQKKTVRDTWSVEEVKALLAGADARFGREASRRKCKDAVLIALHTGARAKEVAGLSYDASRDWLVISRGDTKTDAGRRAIPCPAELRPMVLRWVADAWKAQSVSNQFSGLKMSMGFGPEKTFHGLRHTLLSRLHEQGVQEATAAKIAGHKHKGITYGTYGDKVAVESLRPILDGLGWFEALGLSGGDGGGDRSR
ncbi:tyrosine-type recombinase/integrase [Glycocaulis profundi]|nr:tyrosine-type recombinase/integrase [Glycocaulis profundi]